jgi:hypothetical protein
MATVRLPGGPTLNYREWGRPDGAVVLLLHGLTSSSQSWRNVAPVWEVLPCDARTPGMAGARDAGPFELMRDDVARFAEQVGIPAAIVLGIHGRSRRTSGGQSPCLIRSSSSRRCRRQIQPRRRSRCHRD